MIFLKVFITLITLFHNEIQQIHCCPFVEFKVMKLEIAIRLAVAALNHCREQGFQVGVASGLCPGSLCRPAC